MGVRMATELANADLRSKNSDPGPAVLKKGHGGTDCPPDMTNVNGRLRRVPPAPKMNEAQEMEMMVDWARNLDKKTPEQIRTIYRYLSLKFYGQNPATPYP